MMMNNEVRNVGKEEIPLEEEEVQTSSLEELANVSKDVPLLGVDSPINFLSFMQVYKSVYPDAEDSAPSNTTEPVSELDSFRRTIKALEENPATCESHTLKALKRNQKDLESLYAHDIPKATSTMEEPVTPTKEFVGGILKHPFFLSVSAIAIKATVTALGGDHGIGVFLAGTFGSYSSWYGSKLTRKESDSVEDKEASAGNIDDFND